VKAAAEGQLVSPAYVQLQKLLRQEIITGKLAPGSRLMIDEVARRFRVSHMPVREAFQALQGEGLLEILPHRGARVLRLEREFIANLYDIRGVLEGLMARLGGRRMTPAGLATLTEINSQLESVSKRSDLGRRTELNTKFHAVIYELSGNPEAYKIWHKYESMLVTLRVGYGISHQWSALSIQEHSRLIEAFRKPDLALAEGLTREHVEHSKRDLLKQMAKEPAPRRFSTP
jgi:DNA-binding GntR family transcriptional regulator